MRLHFSRVRRTFCRQCGQEVVRETAEVVAKRLGELPLGTRLLMGFELPVVAMSAGSKPAPDAENGDEADSDDVELPFAKNGVDPIKETIEGLRRRGYGRLLVDGQAVSFDEVDPAALTSKTMLEVVVDRVRIEGDLRSRLTDSIETSYREGGGAAFAVVIRDSGSGIRDSEPGIREP